MTKPYQRPAAGIGSVRLHLNENTAGCSPRVLDVLRALDCRAAGRYPDYDAAREAASAWFGVGRDKVVLTNGLDEGILAATGVALRDRTSGAEGLGVVPAFEMYEICTRALGAAYRTVPLGTEFVLPYEAIRRAVGPSTRIVFLTNPHNPSGVVTPADRLRCLAREIAPAILFVDEAYAEFAGVTLVDDTVFDELPNLLVGRTFSKAYGLAGLRVGAVLGAARLIRSVREVLPPYSVNAWAAAALPVAIADVAYRDWYLAESAASRAMLADACRRLRLRTWPSAGNFVLMDLGENARPVTEALNGRGIVVRDRSNDVGCAGCVRVTAGLVEDTRRFISELEALLCDAAR